MNAGDLKHYASIQRRTSTSAGDTWAEIRKQWLDIVPIGVTPTAELSAQGSKITHRITARETPALEAGQRIVFRGKNYQIVSVVPYIGDRQEATAELLQ
jgi:SPP1 family predicted phage head-tail adaptor